MYEEWKNSEDSCKKGHMAPVNGARTPGAQYFHEERHFTGLSRTQSSAQF